MEPLLLVQTRVPGGVGKDQNKGKGMGGTNVETWKGRVQLGCTQLISEQPKQVQIQSLTNNNALYCQQSAHSTIILKIHNSKKAATTLNGYKMLTI